VQSLIQLQVSDIIIGQPIEQPKPHRSSRVMSTPMDGGAVMLALMTDAKFLRIRRRAEQPVWT